MPVRGNPASRIPIVRRHGRALLGVVVAVRDRGAPVAALCARAVAAIDEYSQILSDSLAEASVSGSEADAERLRREYSRILGEFALAVRDIIPDRETRHAVAQAIQCAVLQHERRLREVAFPAVQEVNVRLR